MLSNYTVHLREQGSKPDFGVIPDGFSWVEAAFGFAWALYIGAWDLALVLLVIQSVSGAVIHLLIDNAAAQGMAHVGVSEAIGFCVHEFSPGLSLLRRLHECGVVSGESTMDAERRFLDTHPDITQRLLGAPS